MPKCEPLYPPYRERCVTVQLPPKLIMRRKTVYTKKLLQYPRIIKKETSIQVPTITETEKVVKVPVVTWALKVIKVPKVYWYPSYVPYPQIICIPRVTVEPKEICQTMLCQPKPQIIDIPPPEKFCCYETGPQTLRCAQPCPPVPPPPCPPYPPCKESVLVGFGRQWRYGVVIGVYSGSFMKILSVFRIWGLLSVVLIPGGNMEEWLFVVHCDFKWDQLRGGTFTKVWFAFKIVAVRCD